MYTFGDVSCNNFTHSHIQEIYEHLVEKLLLTQNVMSFNKRMLSRE